MLLSRSMAGGAPCCPARAAEHAPRPAVPRPRQPCSPSVSGQRPSSSRCPQSRSPPASRCRPACHATQLATYDLLSSKSLSATWFQGCVQRLIGRLSSAPFLHIVHSLALQREETVVLGGDILQSQQACASLSASLAAADPDALIFVHSVDCAEDTCPARKATRRQACGSGCDCATNMAAAASCGVLAGRVGHCCGSDHTGHAAAGHAHTTELALAGPRPSRGHRHEQQHARPRAQQHGRAPEQLEQYHGVVVQSPVFRDVEGCYLLKTVTATDQTGCRCTHFTLTKVCAGVPLLTQLQRAWLVAPPRG